MKKGKNRTIMNCEPIILISKSKEDFLPRYAVNPTPLEYGPIKGLFINVFLALLKLIVLIFLKPGTEIRDVKEVYDREAENYERKHHLTTRGQDTIWRRMAGWIIAVSAVNIPHRIKIK